jgi:PIF1-like helicase
VDIGACTLHSWAGLSTSQPKDDDWLSRSSKMSEDKRRANIQGKEFLIVDEISMEDKVTAYCLSEIVAKSRALEEKGRPHEPYGSMHVIKAGEFHQFPPVGNPTGALYVDRPGQDSKRAILGREIFLQFDKVVILNKQNRITDPIWSEILGRARIGECSTKDLEEIEKLVLTNPECDVPDFTKAPWDQAILVTPRHSVRNLWNEHAIAKHCAKTRNQRFQVAAEDICQFGNDDLSMETKLAIAEQNDKHTGKLSVSVHMAIGMKAMVLLNVATEADIANGTRGEIQDIILDEREETSEPDEEGIIHLRYPPAMLLFKPDRMSKLNFPGLPPGIIPLTPSQVKFSVTGRSGKRFKITRRQYAMTAGYAFTDYKSQGQTIEYVIIDIGRPPTGSSSPFSVYVALSRSRGRDTIRLLRDFDPNLFQNHPSEALREDMRRLQKLNEETKKDWQTRR